MLVNKNYLSIDVTPLPFSPVQFQYNCYSTKETKRRNLMRNKILYIEVYLPLHRLQDKLRHNIAT